MNYLSLELLFNKYYLSSYSDLLNLKGICKEAYAAFTHSNIKKYISSQFLIKYFERLGVDLNCELDLLKSSDLVDFFQIIGTYSFALNFEREFKPNRSDYISDPLFPIKNIKNKNKFEINRLYKQLTSSSYMDSIINFPNRPNYRQRKKEIY